MKKLLFAAACILFLSVSCSKPSGEKANVADAKEVTQNSSASATSKAIDVTSSSVAWKGFKKIGATHNGKISIKQGDIKVSGDNVVGGKVVIDMTTVTAIDMDAEKNGQLAGHLMSADFFESEKFPTATFELTSVEAKANGNNTHTLSGNLTLKGETKNISFPAQVSVKDGKASIIANEFLINRTDFGLKYGSEKHLKGLAEDRIINQEFGISLDVKSN